MAVGANGGAMDVGMEEEWGRLRCCNVRIREENNDGKWGWNVVAEGLGGGGRDRDHGRHREKG